MKTRPIRASAANLLSLLTLFTAAATGQEKAGTHSTSFDPKYYLPDHLFISPKTHPGLFSFTGRWLLSPARPTRPQSRTYHSTHWPGNSVTALVHGSDVSVQIIPKPQGWVENYRFYVSIDGGDDMRYEIPAFNSSELTSAGEAAWFEIKIEGLEDKKKKVDKGAGKNTEELKPHTIRLTSVPETPLSFEGFSVPPVLVRQGREWVEEQDKRVIIEFIGEGSDAERKGGFFGELIEGEKKKTKDAWHKSVQYRVGETLGVRHSHISAGACLLSSCDEKIPGLSTQYFQTSPLHYSNPDSKLDPHHPSYLTAPYRFPSLSDRPQVPIPYTTHLIVDLGVSDLLIHHQSPKAYQHELVLFLARLRAQSHPNAKILVIARPPSYTAFASLPHSLPETPEIDKLRGTLYTVTASAVSTIRTETHDDNIHLLPLSARASTEERAYLSAICPYLLPHPSVLSKLSMNKLGRGNIEWSKPERVCLEIVDEEYEEQLQGSWWKVLLLFAGLVGLWVSRGTLVGACAALCGRRRLGMEEVAERGGRGGHYDKQG